MLMPMLWNGDVMDYTDPFEDMDRAMNHFFGNDDQSLEKTTKAMRTDVIEEDKDYKLQADLPGFRKEDIHCDMKDGVLNISASHSENKDEKNEEGKYIRRERRSYSYSRSFNVGDAVKPEDIQAKYENGVLTLIVPKKEALPQVEETKRIEIQ